MTVVAHIITGLELGGAELFLYRLLKARRGDLQYVVVSLRGGGSLESKIEALGVRVFSIDIRGVSDLPGAYKRVKQIIREQRVNLVQSWMYKADLFATYLAEAVGVPLVWNVRQTNIEFKYNSFGTMFSLRALSVFSKRRVAKIVYCAEASRINHEQAGYNPDIGTVISNGIDSARFKPDSNYRKTARLEFGVDPDTFVVANVGRFDIQKGQIEFIECAARIHQEDPRVRFVMIGKGVTNTNTDLTKAIRRHGLSGRFRLMGEQQRIELLMNGIDIFLGCSAGEGWPNAIAEAMATGVPCVATDVGDTARLIGDAGFVHAYADYDRLAASVIDLVRKPANERREVGFCARDRIKRYFSIEASARCYEDMYRLIATGAH